ncbi:MAG: alpha/beta hydrolase [Rhodospirillaceae bacterium]|nr:alpha/beta hydrolase [Rhodospirillaceae bacterium]
MTSPSLKFESPGGYQIAYNTMPGSTPTVLFLHGLNSDRHGTKAEAVMAHCGAKKYGFARFDMFGHGQSGGRFEDGTISCWTTDALAMIDAQIQGPIILVGSSMGGWIALKAALARPMRVAGLMGIAAAPDFTEDLMWNALTSAQRDQLNTSGVVELPSEYADQPYRISRNLIEDGRKNLLLHAPIALSCPVRLLHGQADTSVPWRISMALAEKIAGGDVETILIKDGDHRLSRPQDLQRLCDALDRLILQVRGS